MRRENGIIVFTAVMIAGLVFLSIYATQLSAKAALKNPANVMLALKNEEDTYRKKQNYEGLGDKQKKDIDTYLANNEIEQIRGTLSLYPNSRTSKVYVDKYEDDGAMYFLYWYHCHFVDRSYMSEKKMGSTDIDAVRQIPEALAELDQVRREAIDIEQQHWVEFAEGHAAKGEYHIAYLSYWILLNSSIFSDSIPDKDALAAREGEILGDIQDVPYIYLPVSSMSDETQRTENSYPDLYWFSVRSELAYQRFNGVAGDIQLTVYPLGLDGWYGDFREYSLGGKFRTLSFSSGSPVEQIGISADGEPILPVISENGDFVYDIQDVDKIQLCSFNPGKAYSPYSQAVIFSGLTLHRC